MNKRADGWRVLAAALALVFAAGAAARAAGTVAGVVISMEGKPKVRPAGGKAYKPVKLNAFVNEGDSLKTDKGERLGIAFVGGAELRINENSVFEVQSGGGTKPASVMTLFGDAWTRLLHGHSGMEVHSPVAVAAVRGTEADIDVGDHMAVKVYEGLVDVMNGKGTTSLKAGQQTSVAGAGQAPAPARAMSPQDYGSWQNGLKPADLNKSLQLLNQAAVKNRTLELQMKGKDGQQKKIKLNFEKK